VSLGIRGRYAQACTWRVSLRLPGGGEGGGERRVKLSSVKIRFASRNRRKFAALLHLSQVGELGGHLGLDFIHALLKLRQLPEGLEDRIDAQEPPK